MQPSPPPSPQKEKKNNPREFGEIYSLRIVGVSPLARKHTQQQVWRGGERWRGFPCVVMSRYGWHWASSAICLLPLHSSTSPQPLLLSPWANLLCIYYHYVPAILMVRQRQAPATLYTSLFSCSSSASSVSSSCPYFRAHSFNGSGKGSRWHLGLKNKRLWRGAYQTENNKLLPLWILLCFLRPTGSPLLISHTFLPSGEQSETKKKEKLGPSYGTSMALVVLTETGYVLLARTLPLMLFNSSFLCCCFFFFFLRHTPKFSAPCHLLCPPASKRNWECTVVLIYQRLVYHPPPRPLACTHRHGLNTHVRSPLVRGCGKVNNQLSIDPL